MVTRLCTAASDHPQTSGQMERASCHVVYWQRSHSSREAGIMGSALVLDVYMGVFLAVREHPFD